MALSIVAVAFGIKNKTVLLKSMICFYSTTFAFCGITFSIWYMLSNDKLFINHGIIYFNISPVYLIALIALSYVLIRFLNNILGKQKNKNIFCDVQIDIGTQFSQLRGKIDTGNTLKEPFSNIPVIVVEYKCVKKIIPKDIINVFEIENVSNINYEKYLKANKKFRLVPFKIISQNGLLPAFKPDKIIISQGNNKTEKEAYVAVCRSQKLGDEFEALINPELIEF